MPSAPERIGNDDGSDTWAGTTPVTCPSVRVAVNGVAVWFGDGNKIKAGGVMPSRPRTRFAITTEGRIEDVKLPSAPTVKPRMAAVPPPSK
jgi:hypothetical protein